MPKAKATPKATPTPRKRGSVAPTATPAREVHKAEGGYTRKGALSIPICKLNDGDSYAITIESVREQMLGNKSIKTPAVLLRSVNIDTGEMMDVIAPAVLVSTLERAYGDDPTTWEGKSILLEASKREGKRYMDIAVFEIEPK